MENFGKFMTFIMIMIVSPIVKGFVIMKLWAWFIVPTFEVSPLRIIEAIGLMFFVNYIGTSITDKNTDQTNIWKKLMEGLFTLISYSGFVLFIGWIASMFM